tara:strand:+ start:546 stop:1217 length:672 start_codon:yes stop_codon:yes gene_type:complete
MQNEFEKFLENQIEKGNKKFRTRGEIFKKAGVKPHGGNQNILKKYINKFQITSGSRLGGNIDLKNKAIKIYFNKFTKNSSINVTKAVEEINNNLPLNSKIGTTIIIDRLNDPNFNTNKLKPQSLSKHFSLLKKIYKSSKEFEEKVEKLNKELKEKGGRGSYVYLEDTPAGGKTVRVHIYGSKLSEYKKKESKYIIAGTQLSTSFPPNEDSLEKIKKLIRENNN